MCASPRFHVRERPEKYFLLSAWRRELYGPGPRFFIISWTWMDTGNLPACNFWSVYLYYGFMKLFLCSSRFDWLCWQNQFLFSDNSFSEELTSCWFLKSCFLLATSQVFSDENRQLSRRAWPLRKLVRQGTIMAESRRWVSNMKMSIILKKGWLYRAAQTKRPILFSSQFFPYFSQQTW